jgi:hypothetical protein
MKLEKYNHKRMLTQLEKHYKFFKSKPNFNFHLGRETLSTIFEKIYNYRLNSNNQYDLIDKYKYNSQ